MRATLTVRAGGGGAGWGRPAAPRLPGALCLLGQTLLGFRAEARGREARGEGQQQQQTGKQVLWFARQTRRRSGWRRGTSEAAMVGSFVLPSLPCFL